MSLVVLLNHYGKYLIKRVFSFLMLENEKMYILYNHIYLKKLLLVYLCSKLNKSYLYLYIFQLLVHYDYHLSNNQNIVYDYYYYIIFLIHL